MFQLKKFTPMIVALLTAMSLGSLAHAQQTIPQLTEGTYILTSGEKEICKSFEVTKQMLSEKSRIVLGNNPMLLQTIKTKTPSDLEANCDFILDNKLEVMTDRTVITNFYGTLCVGQKMKEYMEFKMTVQNETMSLRIVEEERTRTCHWKRVTEAKPQ